MTSEKNRLSTFRPEYFPSVEYFWCFAQCNSIVLTDHFQYSKRKAFSISAPINNSDTVLTIPVSHDNELNPVYRKIISYDHDWPIKHYSTIKHQYQRQPYAYLYLPKIEKLLFSGEPNLSTFLTKQISQISDWLNFNVEINQASEIGYQPDNNNCIIDWCRLFKSSTYINSSFVFENNFVDEDKLKQKAISSMVFIKYPTASIYQYYKNLSILSFLFQFGPEAGYLIKQFLTYT